VIDASVPRTQVGRWALIRAVPVWAWLAGIVITSAGIRFLLARDMVAPWIMVDELVYSELAKSFAATGHFAIRGASAGGSYGLVYPVLLSPAYRLFDSVPDAYDAAKAINSVLMSLAAIPAYLLARRVVSRPLALVAAVLSLAIPSLLYTGTLMTENAFYPIFLFVALALVWMLERPTALNQLGVLALSVLAYETRQQALALFPAVLTAPLLFGRRGLGRFRVLYGTSAAVALAALVVEAARGRTPLALLGAYETAGRHGYSPGAVAKWLLWHVSELDLYLGVVPAAAFLVVALSWRTLERSQRAFVAAAAALSTWMILEVAAFASLPSVTRVEERNLFYVAPLFFVALLLWVQLGAPRPRATAFPLALGCGLLVAALPFAKLIGPQTTSDTLALVPWWKLQEHVHQVRLIATLCAFAASALFLLVPQRYALALPLLVLVYFAISQQPIESRAASASHAARSHGIRSVPLDWIDRSVPDGAEVAAVWTGRTDMHVIWENEFFNRAVGPVYDVARPIPGNLASTPVRIGHDGYLHDASGAPVRGRWLLTDGTLDLLGTKRAADAPLGVNLWEVRGPVRALTQVVGLYPNGTWSGPLVVYRRVGCTDGSLRVTLLGDPSLIRRLQTVRANGVTLTVFPGLPTTMTVPLRDCRARFTVSPTKVPGDGDGRRLGIHFESFEYLPAS
jgi:hypothetical protein